MWGSAMAALRAQGHDARILTTGFTVPDPDPAFSEDPDVHRELEWYWRDHEFPHMPYLERLRLERRNLSRLARHLEEFRPDVVNWWAMGGMSMSLLEEVRRRGVSAVGVVVDEWLAYGPKVDAWQRGASRLGPLRGVVARVTGVPTRVDLAGAADWLFVSEMIRQGATGAGIDPARSALAPGGVDRELFPPASERDWDWRLLYVGRLDERKGIATAVRAMAELPEATLSVIGAGDEAYAAELRALAEQLGVADRITFGARGRDELAAEYAEHDVTLFPVVWEEPWGLVPLESMSVGRPVVATGTGGSGEYLRDGENCLLFAPRDDPQALAGAVRRLAGDAALRARLREDGFTTAGRYTEAAFNAAVARALEAAAGL
jgi:glycosyltransferase involved in cell wall biosynthesis